MIEIIHHTYNTPNTTDSIGGTRIIEKFYRTNTVAV